MDFYFDMLLVKFAYDIVLIFVQTIHYENMGIFVLIQLINWGALSGQSTLKTWLSLF